MLRCSFFCFMESYWPLPWNLLVNFILFFCSQILFSSSSFFCDPFSFEIIQRCQFFVTVCCAQVFRWLTGLSPVAGSPLRPGASWLPFHIRGWGTGRARCPVTAHRLCWWEVLQDARGRASQHAAGPPSYIPHGPGHYFLAAGNVRNCCRCSRLLSSRVVLALYSCLHGFLGSRENKPLPWIRTLISSPNWQGGCILSWTRYTGLVTFSFSIILQILPPLKHYRMTFWSLQKTKTSRCWVL